MRLMSFALTERQLLDGTKTVTRRKGWTNLRAGDRVCAVAKAMGLKRGEHPRRLAVLEIVDVRRERLDSITAEDVVAEGFPTMTPAEFVAMFMLHMKCWACDRVTRIEFRKVEP
jgi:hypothetical protein